MKCQSRILGLMLLAAGLHVSAQENDYVAALSGQVATAEIEQLPITGLMKVTEADGTVKYLSTDRRFVFVGSMYDLWKGDALAAGVTTDQRIEWDRNGVSVEKISFSVGSVVGQSTIIVAPECQDCKDLLKLALETVKDDLNVVLLSSSKAGSRDNALVWCSKDRLDGLRSVYFESRQPDPEDINKNCDQFGLMLADQAAQLFGIGQLPMFVDSKGNGYTGEQAIYAVSNQGKSNE